MELDSVPSKYSSYGCWRPDEMEVGVFDIRSFYNKLRDSPSTVFPCKAIWRAKAPR